MQSCERRAGWVHPACWMLVVAVGCSGPNSKPNEPEQSATQQAEVQGSDATLFDEGTVQRIDLTLDQAAMGALTETPRKYVVGSFRRGDAELDRVSMRFKGHRTMRDWTGKPSFKLHFGRKAKGRRFLGQKVLYLDNNADDPTGLRKVLAYRIARELGLPAPRTGLAEVYVNKELFGLYTLVEAPGKPLLKRYFSDAEGPLYEGEYGCDLYPSDALRMELERGQDAGRKRLTALAKAAQGPVDEFIGSPGTLDRAAFLRFLAVGGLVGDFDGYRHAHNYRMYWDAKAEHWFLLPWGWDRVLRGERDPFDHRSVAGRKCLADAACRLAYVKELRTLSERFDALGLVAQFAKLEAVASAAAARDPRAEAGRSKRERELGRTRRYLAERGEELRDLLGCWTGSKERDADGDGYGCTDCDDADRQVHPGAEERCNKRDDNCSGRADDAPICGCEPLQLGEATFALCNQPMTWPEAAEFCRGLGGNLAHVASEEQAEALAAAVAEVEEDEWWIGLADRQREGHFQWSHGGALKLDHWAKGEPDPYRCGQDCVALKEGQRHGKFRDMHCARPQPFVCSVPQPAETARGGKAKAQPPRESGAKREPI